MMTSIQRIRAGALALLAVGVLGVIGYHMAGYGLVEALWMVVITVSSVGYGERSQLSHQAQLLTIGLIVTGMTAAAYTLGGFLQMLTEGEINEAFNRRRIAKGIEQLKEHIVICGYGRMGELVASNLIRRKRQFVVVESDEARLEAARDAGLLFVSGDATEEDVLEAAGVVRAATVVTALPEDASNVFITLTARNLNPSVQILARANRRSTERKLRQAGANKIVLPTLVSAENLVRMITRPSAADLMELITDSFSDVEVDEVSIRVGHPLVGQTLGSTQVHREHGLLVVGVKKYDGSIVFNPGGSYAVESADVLILMGRAADIEQFRQRIG